MLHGEKSALLTRARDTPEMLNFAFARENADVE